MFDDTGREFFGEDHRIFREQVRAFIAREIEPHHARWEDEGMVSRDAWLKAGEAGMLCPSVPDEDGGVGGDVLHALIVVEELARSGCTGPGFWIHSEMVAPYLTNFGTPEQRATWLPRMTTGEAIGAVAMTEPGAGSDLKGMRTRATRTETGWRLNGQKVFISNGQSADVVVTAAKTGDDSAKGGGISLFLVDSRLPGFRRGRNLGKLGVHAQDTSELFFDDIELPADALLGDEGRGFAQLRKGLGRERLAISVSCIGKAEHAFASTVAYVKDRRLFGQGLMDFQNTRFRLADVKTDLTVGRAFVDDMIRRYLAGTLDETTTASAKLWTTEMLGRVTDTCLQLHGGWGYMTEFPIARAYADARVERIAGGASEVMREIIGRSI